MDTLDKFESLKYIVLNNPVCMNCVRGNLEEVRMAAGLYQLIKDILTDKKVHFDMEELDQKIKHAVYF